MGRLSLLSLLSLLTRFHLTTPHFILHDNVYRQDIDYGHKHPFHPDRVADRKERRKLTDDDEFESEPFKNMRVGFSNEFSNPSYLNGLTRAEFNDRFNAEVLEPAREHIQRLLLTVPVPSDAPIKVGNRAYAFFGLLNTPIPETYATTGVTDIDFFFFNYDTSSSCSSGTLGFATTVAEDKYNRPTYGAVNFCPSALNGWIKKEIATEYLIALSIHELNHALGFSSDGVCKMRDADGVPYTTLTAAGDCPRKVSKCVDGGNRVVGTPSETIFKPITTPYGMLAYELSTPKVLAVIRSYYNCDTLTGAQFENQPTSYSCFGDHFDEQLFFQDLQSAFAGQHYTQTSPLDAAYFEDTHWYIANYTYTDVLSYGHGAGCSFFNMTCGEINYDFEAGTLPPSLSNTFCNIKYNTVNTCDPSYQFYGYCSDGYDQNENCPIVREYSNIDRCTNLEDSTHRCWSSDDSSGNPAGAQCLPTRCVTGTKTVQVKFQSRWVECEPGQEYLKPDTWTTGGSKIRCPNVYQMCPEFSCLHSCSGRGLCDWTEGTCDCFDGNTNLSDIGCVDYGVAPSRRFYREKPITIRDRISRRWNQIKDAFSKKPSEWTTEQAVTVILFVLLVAFSTCLLCAILSPVWRRKSRRAQRGDRRQQREKRFVEQAALERSLREAETENAARVAESREMAKEREEVREATRRSLARGGAGGFQTQDDLWAQATSERQYDGDTRGFA